MCDQAIFPWSILRVNGCEVTKSIRFFYSRLNLRHTNLQQEVSRPLDRVSPRAFHPRCIHTPTTTPALFGKKHVPHETADTAAVSSVRKINFLPPHHDSVDNCLRVRTISDSFFFPPLRFYHWSFGLEGDFKLIEKE